MLLLIFFIIVFAIGIAFIYFDNKWDTVVLEFLGGIAGAIGMLGTFTAIAIFISSLCTAPKNQAEWEQRYDKLINKVEHIDSYNYDDIVSEVDEWNEEWREQTYAKKSPWVGWYYTIDTSTTDLIKINN